MKNKDLFWPRRAFFEPDSLRYELGRRLRDIFTQTGTPVFYTPSHNRVTGIPGQNPRQKYAEAKRTLVVGVKKDLRFESCRPSADYEVALGTSCPGGCEYCYLAATLGRAPYIRVYVNIDEILASVEAHIRKAEAGLVTFEAASASDPLAVEHLTGSLARIISFFGANGRGRLRAVTKYAAVDPLIPLAHNGHTRFRFSINTNKVIRFFEHNTSSFQDRITAARRMQGAGYPLGFIIAPIIAGETWRTDYESLLFELHKALPAPKNDLTFELITHRYTKRAKNIILERFPRTKLAMNDAERRSKYGHYGYVKYVYPPKLMDEIRTFFTERISALFPQARIEYFT
ncbi:MAG: spore photoproduct lyase [Bacillota bacterium]